MAGPVSISVTSLDGANGFEMLGTEASAQFGRQVSSAGDINGDGIEDFVVSATGVPGANNYGALYVVFGTGTAGGPIFDLNSLDGTNGFRLDGEAQNDFAGFSVASGDFNGDGFSDLVFGAPYADPNGGYSGAAYVVWGHSGAFAPTLNLGSLNGSNGIKIIAAAPDDNAGYSVSSAGDFNGDGIEDFVIAAKNSDSANGNNAGTAYVVYGRDGGIAPFNVNMVGSSVLGFQILGPHAYSYLAKAMTSGDINGDGFSDLLFGVEKDGNGAAYVVFGHGGPGGTVDLGALNGTDGISMAGLPFSARLGGAVALGDINGDGFDDMIVGARNAASGAAYGGSVYVLFGKASGLNPYIDLTTLDGTNGFRVDGKDFFGNLGSAVAAGDINSDGYDDLVIGGQGGGGTGEVYVIYGKAGGFSASFSVLSLDGNNGYTIQGVSNSGLGNAVTLGDFNGDGGLDILAGAWTQTTTYNFQGGAYVVYSPLHFSGSAGADTHSGSAMGDTLSGGAGGDILYGLAGADTLDGGSEGDWLDGGTGIDSLSGGTGDDTYVIDDAGDSVIELSGEGNDVVHASVSWTMAANIERLILDGTADIGGTGNGMANTMVGNDGANTLDGAAGEDIIKGGLGGDTLTGGAGNDQLFGGDGDDSLDGQDDNDRLDGGAGADSLFGGIGNDYLDGGADNDTLDGGIGADQLFGGLGVDSLAGGDGNDILDGGAGVDSLAGGLGDDIYYVDDASDTITEASGAGTDTVRATASYILSANVENLVLDGAGAMDGTGNGSANAITGNASANTLDGGAGDDVLKGMNGDDVLIGGAGNDILVGGAGADTFVVFPDSIKTSGAVETDIVNDLNKAQGDRLDLSIIDADTLTAGDQGFHLVGGFSHHAAEMTLTFVGGNTLLALDVDGDGRADYRMTIVGNVTGDSGGWVL